MALRLQQQEEEEVKKRERRSSRNGKKLVCNDDDFMEDDEAMAYMLALKESEKDATRSTTASGKSSNNNKKLKRLQKKNKKGINDKPKKKKKKKKHYASSDDEQIFLEESDQEEEEDQEDSYMEQDESERQAGTVLRKANELSATVLKTMTEWYLHNPTYLKQKQQQQQQQQQGGGGGEEKKNGIVKNGVGGSNNVPCGIIVDGALALSTLGSTSDSSNGTAATTNGNVTQKTKEKTLNDIATTKSSSSSSSSWISQEVMQRICPQLKLADYQLIGVNWLALLHGMTCDVNQEDTKKVKGKKRSVGSGKNTSVNGVLADEMGLGKTVQTIAFLAWLRHHNSRSSSSSSRTNNNNHRRRKIRDPGSDHSDDDDDEENYHNGSEGDKSVICLDDDDNDDDDNIKETKGNNVPLSSNNRPHIVIVPASVLSNWEREFHTFCPDMTVVKYHGSINERMEIQSRLRMSLAKGNDDGDDDSDGDNEGFYRGSRRKKFSQKRLPLDVVLTTFSYFSTEKSDDRSFLRKFHFDYMVVDEAHCLKNPRGMRYKNMDKFSTSHRLLLTGTPVQNSPKELMSLLCFLMPLFTRQQSVNDFEKSNENDGGEKMLEHFVTLEKAGGKRGSVENPNEHAYRKLKQLLAPFILRRRKSVVLSQLMPPKTRKVEFVPFDESTRTVYDSIISSHLKNRENKIVVDDASSQKNLFVSLRKAANHPLLLRMRHNSGAAMKHLSHMCHSYGYFGRDATCTLKLVQKELENFSDYDVHCAALDMIEEDPSRRNTLSKYILQEEDLFCSPKFVRLHSLLPQLIRENHRMLIFSQWTRCLDLLGCLLESMDLKFLRLDGQTAIPERQQLIDEFNSDSTISVFLLSTRAGGMGINLTAADTCILHDLDFNPFNDIQAEDRCHRIGQKKPVTIIKMVTEGTVDADIYAMQERKSKMNAAIFEDENGSIPEQNNRKGKSAKKSSNAKKDDVEITRIVQCAMDRFLSSPAPKHKNGEKGMIV